MDIMTLKEYLEKHNISQRAFAKKIKHPSIYVNRLINGAVPTKKDDMAAITAATEGLVRADDFFYDEQ